MGECKKDNGVPKCGAERIGACRPLVKETPKKGSVVGSLRELGGKVSLEQTTHAADNRTQLCLVARRNESIECVGVGATLFDAFNC